MESVIRRSRAAVHPRRRLRDQHSTAYLPSLSHSHSLHSVSSPAPAETRLDKAETKKSCGRRAKNDATVIRGRPCQLVAGMGRDWDIWRETERVGSGTIEALLCNHPRFLLCRLRPQLFVLHLTTRPSFHADTSMREDISFLRPVKNVCQLSSGQGRCRLGLGKE